MYKIDINELVEDYGANCHYARLQSESLVTEIDIPVFNSLTREEARLPNLLNIDKIKRLPDVEKCLVAVLGLEACTAMTEHKEFFSRNPNTEAVTRLLLKTLCDVDLHAFHTDEDMAYLKKIDQLIRAILNKRNNKKLRSLQNFQVTLHGKMGRLNKEKADINDNDVNDNITNKTKTTTLHNFFKPLQKKGDILIASHDEMIAAAPPKSKFEVTKEMNSLLNEPTDEPAPKKFKNAFDMLMSRQRIK